jgi:hypothetical protein
MSAGLSWNQRNMAVIDRRYSEFIVVRTFFSSLLVSARF